MTESKVISKIMPRPLTVDELHSIKSSTLLILGAKYVTSSKTADRIIRELAELKPKFQFEILKEAGHLWAEQQYLYAGNKIEKFLDHSAI